MEMDNESPTAIAAQVLGSIRDGKGGLPNLGSNEMKKQFILDMLEFEPPQSKMDDMDPVQLSTLMMQ